RRCPKSQRAKLTMRTLRVWGWRKRNTRGESSTNTAYIVTTNLFLAQSRGCHLSGHVACCDYLKRRRTAHASPTPSPALVNRPGPPATRSRLRPGEPSSAPVGRHLSVDGAGRGR